MRSSFVSPLVWTRRILLRFAFCPEIRFVFVNIFQKISSIVYPIIIEFLLFLLDDVVIPNTMQCSSVIQRYVQTFFCISSFIGVESHMKRLVDVSNKMNEKF